MSSPAAQPTSLYPKTPPAQYPQYPRQVPAIPDYLKSDEVNATILYINERLSRLDQVDQRKAEVLQRGQKWADKSSVKMENRIWKKILPGVLLGTRFIFENMIVFSRQVRNDEEDKKLGQDIDAMFRFHTTVSFDPPISCHLMCQY